MSSQILTETHTWCIYFQGLVSTNICVDGGVVSVPLGCKQRRGTRRQMAVEPGVMTLEAFPAESNLW